MKIFFKKGHKLIFSRFDFIKEIVSNMGVTVWKFALLICIDKSFPLIAGPLLLGLLQVRQPFCTAHLKVEKQNSKNKLLINSARQTSMNIFPSALIISIWHKLTFNWQETSSADTEINCFSCWAFRTFISSRNSRRINFKFYCDILGSIIMVKTSFSSPDPLSFQGHWFSGIIYLECKSVFVTF